MIHTFHCPNCHASLDYDADSQAVTVRCEYCNSTVIVPETLRSPGYQSDIPFATPGEQTQILAEIVQLARSGRKIEAIKRFRETFHVGLKDAKDVVEAMERNESIQLGSATIQQGGYSSTFFSGQAEPSVTVSSSAGRLISCLVLVIVAVVGLSILVPILIGGGAAFWGVTRAETVISTVTSNTTFNNTPLPLIIDQSTPEPLVTPTPGFASVALQFGGQEGIGPGFFNDTRQIGLDGDGNIYTGDYSGGRIQVFDATGKFLTQWNAGSDLYMVSMAVDRQGRVYIIDAGTIIRYEGMTGAALDPLAYSGRAYFETIAAAPDGSIVAAGSNNLVRFDAQGNITLDVADPFSSLSGFSTTHEGVAVDGSGSIFILGSEAIYKFDANGVFVNRFGSKGDAPDQFQTSPTALAVDGQGRVYAVDFKGILVFDENGRYLDTIDFRGVAFDMLFNDQNELIVMDRNGNQILKYALNK